MNAKIDTVYRTQGKSREGRGGGGEDIIEISQE